MPQSWCDVETAQSCLETERSKAMLFDVCHTAAPSSGAVTQGCCLRALLSWLLKGMHSALDLLVCAVAYLSSFSPLFQQEPQQQDMMQLVSQAQWGVERAFLLFPFLFVSFLFCLLWDEKAYVQVNGGSHCSILHQHHFAMAGGNRYSVLNIQQACNTTVTLGWQLLFCAWPKGSASDINQHAYRVIVLPCKWLLGLSKYWQLYNAMQCRQIVAHDLHAALASAGDCWGCMHHYSEYQYTAQLRESSTGAILALLKISESQWLDYTEAHVPDIVAPQLMQWKVVEWFVKGKGEILQGWRGEGVIDQG